MALRLKKDVQKASYYVWFLGAQEAKELRGERVLLSTIPRLIERAGHLEPLKVTLQISHKGLKIVQVRRNDRKHSCRLRSSNHFRFFARFFGSNIHASRNMISTLRKEIIFTLIIEAKFSDNIVLLFARDITF